jgi:ABC-type branched-subunit amino acid transport system substrate-binding protein
MRHRRLAAAVTAVGLLLAAACSNQSDDTAEDTATTVPAPTEAPVTTTADTTAPGSTAAETATTVAGESPTTSAAPAGEMFGTMPSPCGPGEATIADGQNGGDTLKIGVANDHGAEVAPGLTQEMLDAGQAFAGWCNAQGGIRGVPLEIVDLDGKFFSVPAAMEQACAEVFAMVGGGWVFDDQMFPRYHECKMINFAGYTVSAQTAKMNGMVQPVPNPPDTKPSAWFEWAKETYPDAIGNTAILYGDYTTTAVVKDEIKATLADIGGFNVTLEVPYAAAGESNWAPFAQQLKDNNITFMTFVGSPAPFIPFARAMREVGYVPEVVLLETNFYDDLLTADGLETVTDGFFARTVFAPFQEPDLHPAMKSYNEMMDTYKPDGKKAGLGLQATSAFLLFAQAANDCAESNGDVLERECILAAGKQITSWTGGGLHAETDPSSNLPPQCGLIMKIENGEWVREFPEIGGPDDNSDGAGFRCYDPGRADSSSVDHGDLTLGVDPSRPN